MSGFGAGSKRDASRGRSSGRPVPAKDDPLWLLAVKAHRSGNLPEAEKLYRNFISAGQASAPCLANLAIILKQTGRLTEAAEMYQQLLLLEPTNVNAAINLGSLLNRQGLLDEAINCAQLALRLQPRNPQALMILSSVFIKRDALQEARLAAEEALLADPALATAHVNIAGTYLKQKNYNEALGSAEAAICIDPNLAEAYQALGTIQIEMGLFADALKATQRAVRLKPSLVEAQLNLGSILIQLERPLEALVPTRQAIALNPALAKAHMNHACILVKLERFQEAVEPLRESFRLEPGLAEAHCLLSDIYKKLERYDLAIQSIRQALDLEPENLSYLVKATTLYDQVCDFASLSSIQQSTLIDAVKRHAKPRDLVPILLEYSMHCLHHAHRIDDYTPYLKVVAALANGFSELIASQGLSSSDVALPAIPAEGKLRVGFVGGDFRDHVVGRFLMPLFKNIDCGQYDFFCYSTQHSDDAFGRQFAARSAAFRDITNLSNAEAVALIRSDQIHILFDLAGFTAGCRPEIFVRRAAPCQVGWLGYPATTGLAEMDYILLDHWLDSSSLAGLVTEERVITPGPFLCFDQWPDWEISSVLPEDRHGCITIGTLNHPRKYTLPTLSRWASVVLARNDVRLLIARSETASPLFVSNVKAAMSSFGVSESRLIFSGPSEGSYLESYNQIDLCLDTYPYTGTTTTVDSLWMGVPVVSLEGPAIHQRASAAVLRHAGLDQLIAENDDEFLDIACSLIDHPGLRRDMRQNLRSTLLASPLCDAKDYAASFCSVLEQLRVKACAS